MAYTHESPTRPRQGATGPFLETSHTDSTTDNYHQRIGRILPAGLSALYGQSSLPACSCRQNSEPCLTCRSYDLAGRGIEAAALALGQGNIGPISKAFARHYSSPGEYRERVQRLLPPGAVAFPLFKSAIKRAIVLAGMRGLVPLATGDWLIAKLNLRSA